MKKILLLVALMMLIMITTSCQKPEEITLSKYFQAMKAKDRDTMAAMAAEPMALEFKSWELVSSDAPVTEDLILQQLITGQAEIKAKKDKQIGIVKAEDQAGGNARQQAKSRTAEADRRRGAGRPARNGELQASPGRLYPDEKPGGS
jgi:hypothetical protein